MKAAEAAAAAAAGNKCSSTDSLKLRAEAARLMVKLHEPATGLAKSEAQLRADVSKIKKAIHQLETSYDRAMPIHVVAKLAEVLERHPDVSAEQLASCPGITGLPACIDNKYQHMLGSFGLSPPPAAAAAVGCKEVVIKDLPSYALKVFKDHRTQIGQPDSMHALADADACAFVESSSAPQLNIKADLIEWYSDKFMHALDCLIKNQKRPSKAPLSPAIIGPCSYEMRARIAENLGLKSPNMWNMPMDIMAVGYFNSHVQLLPQRMRAATSKYLGHRDTRMPFSPLSSAEADIRALAASAYPYDKDVLIAQTHRVFTTITVLKEHEQPFIDILDGIDPSRPLSLSQWADLQGITVTNRQLCNSQHVVVLEPALLELYSADLLKAITGHITKHACSNAAAKKPSTRAEALDLITSQVRTVPLPVQRALNCMPTHHLLRAYRRYILSPQCAYSQQQRALILSRMPDADDAVVMETRGENTRYPVLTSMPILVQPQIEELHLYPLSFLWLAARFTGSLATRVAGRAQLYGIKAKDVAAFEEDLVKHAYSNKQTDKYTKLLRCILEQRLRYCTPTEEDCPHVMYACVSDPTELSFIRAYKARLSATTHMFAAKDVVQHIDDATPKLALRIWAAQQLDDQLIHILLAVLCDGDDDDPVPWHDTFHYSSEFKTGFFRLIQQFPPSSPCVDCSLPILKTRMEITTAPVLLKVTATKPPTVHIGAAAASKKTKKK